MRKLILLSLFFTASILTAQNLKVHEWGTFTTLSGSNGERLNGLVLEEEFLPNFVYQHDRYHPTFGNKGFGLRTLNNVNVKMETPVIYFYSDTQTDVDVRVDFPRGCISQWYPERTAGEQLLKNDTIDFSKSMNGWIQWKGTVLSPNDKTELSAPKSEVTKTWATPRETDANNIRATQNKETEKYLFYRGLGNFDLPLNTSCTSEGTLHLSNSGASEISYALVYHQYDSLLYDTEGKVTGSVALASVWWSGRISAGQSMSVAKATTYHVGATAALQSEYENFIAALEKAGLYRKEAEAMLTTWFTSYFNHSGLRVFWIVPRTLTDEIIPMQIQPVPTALERVLVGRSEVLTPAFERELYNDLANNNESKWNADRYFLAYKQRVSSMKSSGVESGIVDEDDIAVYPNPANHSLMIELSNRPTNAVSVSVKNMIGKEVFTSSYNSPSMNIDISSLPIGLYRVSVTNGVKTFVKEFIKE